MNVNEFSDAGRECLARATHEHRFLDNNSNESMNSEGVEAKMKLSNRELATLVLDARMF